LLLYVKKISFTLIVSYIS